MQRNAKDCKETIRNEGGYTGIQRKTANTMEKHGMRQIMLRKSGWRLQVQGLWCTEWYSNVQRVSKEYNEMQRNAKEYNEIPRNTRKYKRSTK